MTARAMEAPCRSGTGDGQSVTMCPHCGFNFAADGPIVLSDWTLFSHYSMRGGAPFRLTRAESAVLYALAKAGGDWVSTEAILNRVSDSESPNVVSTLVASLRKKLGHLSPIESERGQRSRGYRWREGAL